MHLTRNKHKALAVQSNTLFKRIYEICFFVLFTGYFLFYEVRTLQFGFVVIGLVGSLIITLNKLYLSAFKFPLNVIWYFLFFVLAEISAIWAHSPENAVNRYLRLMVILIVILLGISQYVDTTSDAEILLKIFVFSVFLISSVQLIFTPSSEWASGYFGSVVGGHNTNTFGFVCSMSLIITFYFAYTKSKRSYYLLTVFFLVCCIFSSSRKAVGISMIGAFLVILMAFRKKNHLLHLIISSFTLCFVVVLFFIDQTLYEIIGFRFESLLNLMVSGTTQSESSLLLRDYFIQFAKILFEEKPLFGHGFANFSVLLSTESNVNQNFYAHNNYWEILADLGVLGFIVYYWFYAVIFFKLVVRLFKEKNNTLLSLGLVLLISQLILEWGVVSMASFYPQIVVSLIYTCSYASDSKRKFHYAPRQI